MCGAISDNIEADLVNHDQAYERATTKQLRKASKEQHRGGFLREVGGFLAHTKKWWLLPILITLLLFGLLILLSGTGVAPFIYTLF